MKDLIADYNYKEVFKMDNIETVGPQHEFMAGDIVVLRQCPNTTRLSVPSRSARLRWMEDEWAGFWGTIDWSDKHQMMKDKDDQTPNRFNFEPI